MSQANQQQNVTQNDKEQENSSPSNTHDQFVQSNPLSFELYNLYDPSNRNILYTNDEPDNLRFNLEIRNLLKETISLEPYQPEGDNDKGPNKDNFHIELQFKAGELSQKSLQLIDLSESSKEEWSMGRRQPSGQNNTFSIFIRKRKSKLELKGKDTDGESAEDKATITLVGIGAGSVMGARATQLNVNHQGFKLDKTGPLGRKNSLIVLTILNHSGERSAPLVVKFAHSPKVLNNGYPQEITIQMVNTGQEAISFNENSKFVITVDVQGEADEPWALAEKDEAIELKADDIKILRGGGEDSKENWSITGPDIQGEDPVWTVKPTLRTNETSKQGNTTIQPNEDILIKLTNFKTSLRAGIGNLSVGYYNLPGYRDKTHILGVYKTCIVERRAGQTDLGRIGINKLPDQDTQLDVVGKIAADTLAVAGTVTANKFVGKGAFFEGMIIMWSGSVNNIPEGWALCNGVDGTPDLRDRFIVGAGLEYSPSSLGGEKAVTLTEKNMPEHNHELQDDGHSHTISIAEHYQSFSGWDGDDHPLKNRKQGDRDGQYTVSTEETKSNISVKSFGENKPESFSIIPQYFALSFIIYVGS